MAEVKVVETNKHDWLNEFLKYHAVRLFYIILGSVFATLIYIFIEDARSEVKAIYFLFLGIMVNQARGPKQKEVSK